MDGASKTRIFDLHCDTLDELAWPTLPAELNCGQENHLSHVYPHGALVDIADAPGHLSLDKMDDCGWCQCFAVFVPDELDVEQSLAFFEHVSATLEGHRAAHPDRLAIARDAREIAGIVEAGRTCALLTVEGGKLLAAADDMVERLAVAGVKMLTLTWNGPNPLGSGHDTQDPLTALGVRRVAELEAARIVVDVSHLNDPGFADVDRIARRPFAASHSNSRAVHDVPRNLTDDQFRAIRDAGGVVGLNYYTQFISDSADPTPEELFAHVDHFLDLDGGEVVALGSDYDGCDTPSWLDPGSKVGTLARLLAERYGEEQAERICWRNAHDFFVRNEG